MTESQEIENYVKDMVKQITESHKEEKYIKEMIKQVKGILERKVFKALQDNCKNNKREILLLIHDAVSEVTSHNYFSRRETARGTHLYNPKLLNCENTIVRERFLNCYPYVLQPIMGEANYHTFLDCCYRWEATPKEVLSNAVREELDYRIKKETSID
jgi:hypothetical protein